MIFTNPIWLWGFTGIAIPIAIHLLSRKEGKVILIGSLRYLRDSPTAQFRHIRLNEILLLLLRCLLLTWVVLILAGISFNTNAYEGKKWLVIEKGIEDSQRYKKLIDSLSKNGFDVRLFRQGFPLPKDSIGTRPLTSYWAAAQQLGSLGLDSVVIISFGYQKNFIGERIALPASVSWFTEDPSSQAFTATNVLYRKDSVWKKSGSTSATETKFETRKERLATADKTKIDSPDTIRVAIFAEEKFRYDQKIFQATLDAIQTITPHIIIVSILKGDEPTPNDSSWIVWLSDKTFPYPYEKKIAYIECQASPLLDKANKLRESCPGITASGYILSKRLHEDVVLKENFTIRLAAVLLEKTGSPVVAYDNRVLPERQVWSQENQTGSGIAKSKSNDIINTILIVSLIVTLVGERILAYQRNQ
jgi:hypothetical protein